MEQLQRFSLIVGDSVINCIQNKTVLVLGLGGVGSYAIESLVRSGIGKLILVDYDVVDITNLNRQLMTDHTNIGKYKTNVWKDRIEKINPKCNVIIINEKINKENIEILFQNHIDYVVDACDTLMVKKELILKCLNKKIKLISSMGTGNKLDPSKLKIMDIRKTSYDPLAKSIRKMVNDMEIKDKIMVVCSDEQPRKISNPIGSTSFVPSVAGLLCASYIINDIIKNCE